MHAVRRPLVITAALLVLVAFAVELGSRLWIARVAGAADLPRPGLGIPSLAALDGLLFLSLAIIALSALGMPPQLLARLNGIVTAIVAFLTLFAGITLAFVTFALLMLMVGLLLAVPFGTMVYMAVFGDFNRDAAAITLGTLMLLKVAAAILEVLGGPQILKSKSLILMFACSIGLTFLLTFLHGLPPGFLVSITDGIGALIAFIVAIIWSIAYLIGGIIAFVGNLQAHRQQSDEH